MNPYLVLTAIAGYSLAVFGLTAFIRSFSAPGSPENVRAVRRRIVLVTVLAFAAVVLFLRHPTIGEWGQLGFAFSAVANLAFAVAMYSRLRVMRRG